MEGLIKSRSEVKQYCVYAHRYGEQLFYIGSGEVYRNIFGLLRGRPYQLNFEKRSPQWWEFCNGEKDKVTVEILFVTNDQKESLDKETEIIKSYIDQGFPLVNKYIGTHPSEEQKIKLSEINKSENNMEELIKLHSEVKQYCVYVHYYNEELFYIGSGRIYTKEERQVSRPYQFHGRSQEWYELCNWEIDQVVVKILFVTDNEKLLLDKEEEITRYYMELEIPLANLKIGNKMSEEQKKNMSGENHPFYGKTFSEEYRRKLSEAHKGKPSPLKGKNLSEETRNKISEAMKGKMFGEGNPMYGKKHSEESRKKMSEAQKGEKSHMWGKRGKDHPTYGKVTHNAKKVLIVNNETGKTKSFDSITRAYEFVSLNGFDKSQSTLQYRLNKGRYNFENYTLEKIA